MSRRAFLALSRADSRHDGVGGRRSVADGWHSPRAGNCLRRSGAPLLICLRLSRRVLRAVLGGAIVARRPCSCPPCLPPNRAAIARRGLSFRFGAGRPVPSHHLVAFRSLSQMIYCCSEGGQALPRVTRERSVGRTTALLISFIMNSLVTTTGMGPGRPATMLTNDCYAFNRPSHPAYVSPCKHCAVEASRVVLGSLGGRVRERRGGGRRGW